VEALAISVVSTMLFAFMGWTNLKSSKSLELLVEQKYQVLEKKLDDMGVMAGQGMSRVFALERDLLQLRAELPDKYVARDDAIRLVAVTDARIEGLRADVQTIRLLLEGMKNAQ